jgi:O-antigen/teichoic acid export membrane protein
MSKNDSVTDIDEIFKTEHLKSELGSRSIQGGIFSITAQGVGFCLQLGSMVVLGRLLDVEDFGLVAMVFVVTNFVAMFKDMGLSMATVQKQEINHKQISTLFWINLTISVFMTIVTIGIAPVISWFYEEPRLTWITVASSLAFIFGGFTIQHQALLRRQMRFGVLALIQITSMLVGVLAGIVLAWCGGGYWAIVIIPLVTAVVASIGVWIACGWRPGLPVRNSGVRTMLAFGGHVAGFSIANYFARNLDKILIGRFYSAASLGLYDRAYQIVRIPIVNIRAPLLSVAIPALSRIKEDPLRYKNYYSKFVLLLSMVSMPIIAFLFVCSKSVILLVLGDKWIGMNSIFKILAIASFIEPVANTRGSVLISLGQSGRYLKWGIFNSIAIVVSFIFGIKWGVLGVAVSYVIARYLILLPSLWYCFRLSAVSIGSFFGAIWQSILASLIMGVVIFFSHSFMVGQSHFIQIIASLIIGLTVYLFVWLVMPGGIKRLRELRGYLLLIFPRKRDSQENVQ